MSNTNETVSLAAAGGSNDRYVEVIDAAGANPQWRPSYKDAPSLLEAVVSEHQKQLSKAFVRRVFNGLITQERKAENERKNAEKK